MISVRFSVFVVMPGLDPGIHSGRPSCCGDDLGMDCRVKPGNDDVLLGNLP